MISFFVTLLRTECNRLVQVFLDICNQIKFPVSMEKTVWATTSLCFLGMLLNSVTQTVSVPVEKVEKALLLVQDILNHRKTTVKKLQKLTGFLNFLCRCVVPGHTFTRRLYAYTSTKLAPHHHIRVNVEMCNDLQVWQSFLNNPVIYCRPFIDFSLVLTASQLQWFTDASGRISFGGIHEKQWFLGQWTDDFLSLEPSIEFLELYAVTVSVLLWIEQYVNRRICLFCDNQAVVQMVNNATSSCKQCMVLIRILTLRSLEANTRIFAKYVPTAKNSFADALSRNQMGQFWRLARSHNVQFEENPREIPSQLWPIREKLWIN